MTTASPLRPVNDEQVETFWRDGFVCLRQAISGEWIERMRAAVERWLASPECIDYTEFGESMAQQAGLDVMLDDGERGGRFYSGLDHWTSDADFSDFARCSPLPGLVAALLKSAKLNLYEDSVLVKEPGAIEKTAFHQDMSYFHVEGHQVCTTWVPLDPVREDTGALSFIPGSHLWKKKYRPNFFTSELLMPDTEGEAVPDFHKRERSREAVSFDMEPGDITVHHARTIHGAGGNRSQSVRRRAISVRYCGDDARYRLRRGVPAKPHHADLREGDALDNADFPLVWPGTSENRR